MSDLPIMRAKDGAYPEDGSDENNTFAKFTPNAEFRMTVQNSALIGRFQEGDEFYVDFTRCGADR